MKKIIFKFFIALLIFAIGWHWFSWETGLAMEIVFYIGTTIESILNEIDKE